MKRLLICLMFCAFSLACESPTDKPTAQAKPSPSLSPSPDALTAAIENEGDIQDEEDAGNRTPVRKAALEYLKSAQPDAKVEGVNLFAYSGNLYVATIDVTQEKQRRSISLIVRMFIKDNGETYWKVEPMIPETSQILTGYLAHKYTALKSKYDTLKYETGK